MESQIGSLFESVKERYKRYKHIGPEYDEEYANSLEKSPYHNTFMLTVIALSVFGVLMWLAFQGLAGLVIAVCIFYTILAIIGILMLVSLFRRGHVKEDEDKMNSTLDKFRRILMACVALVFLYPLVSVLV